MTDLLTALREKYATPKDVLRALALDENILREPKDKDMSDAPLGGILERIRGKPDLAQDADIKDLIDLIDALKAANMPSGAEELGEEDDDEDPNEDGDEDMEDNGGLPIPGGKEAEDDDMDGMGGVDNEGGEEGGNVHMRVAKMLMQCAKLLASGGEEEKPAIDGDPEAEEIEAHEKKKDDAGEGYKPAMDAAIKVAVADERKRQRELRAAENFVRPWVGELGLALDSAEQVHRHAAKALGIKGAETIHASALTALIEMQPKPGARKERREDFAMDAVAVKGFASRYPDAAKTRLS